MGNMIMYKKHWKKASKLMIGSLKKRLLFPMKIEKDIVMHVIDVDMKENQEDEYTSDHDCDPIGNIDDYDDE